MYPSRYELKNCPDVVVYFFEFWVLDCEHPALRIEGCVRQSRNTCADCTHPPLLLVFVHVNAPVPASNLTLPQYCVNPLAQRCFCFVRSVWNDERLSTCRTLHVSAHAPDCDCKQL